MRNRNFQRFTDAYCVRLYLSTIAHDTLTAWRVYIAPLRKTPELFYRLQPVLVFVVVAFVGILTAIASWYTIHQANRLTFLGMADDAVQRVGDRIENHMLLIKSAEAHFQATGEVPSANGFKTFVSYLQKTEQFNGV